MCQTGEVQDGKIIELDCPNPEVEWWEAKHTDLMFGRCADHRFAPGSQSHPDSLLYKTFSKLTFEEFTIRMVMDR